MAENFIVNDTEYVQLQEINIRIHRKIMEKPVTVWRVYYGLISHNTNKVLLKLEKITHKTAASSLADFPRRRPHPHHPS